MHLRVLKLDEKKALLDLAFYFFNLDNSFTEHEKNFMKIYSHATLIDLKDYFPKKKSLQQIMLSFKDSSIIVKKSIFYEISMLVFNDHSPSEKELKFLDFLKNEWNIPEQDLKDAEKNARITNNNFDDLKLKHKTAAL
jgi:hypothetical protein